ncbi:hypothetical protein BSZ35_15385 [Salinibacter sp. 10B]|uniref:fibronectin type III domain-containing protein n=1 Tax=Salinibacter sp. 10B TaxID=1923971 RepID=UPI000CF3BEE0|nr:fibronectin type III domain-containing protein [Salinibacter sp. 10B]PQJ35795.1 hypothetical protein BSZ35_15385 [Salinibacter sp. 10B]
MSFRSLSSLLVLLLIWSAGAASAQQGPPLPSRQHASALQTQSALPVESLPSVDEAALRAEDARRADRIGPARYGTVLNTTVSPTRDGTWEQLPSGNWLWRIRLQSQDAVSMSVGLKPFQLPEGAQLYLYGPEGTLVHGPYTNDDATNGQLWTPLVPDAEITLELEVPANRRSAVTLRVADVIHGYRSLHSARTPGTKSGTCNLDVACEEADPWQSEVRSVGGYTFSEGESALVCTGALINNTAEDGRPLFLTAEHCVSNAQDAASMVFYWNVQTSTCRTPGTPENGTQPDSLEPQNWGQTSTGAVLRARYGNVHRTNSIAGRPDLSLVEVDDDIPTDYNLFLSGWSRIDTPPSESVTIHHPQGHGKRISFDNDPARVTGYGEPSSGDTHLRIGAWDLGTTEPGSSGSPLFNENQRIVGVLSGGLAGCVNGTAEDNDEPDWYGHLAAGFENGDYQDRTIADVLDPLDSGVETLDGIPLLDNDDNTPPAKIDDLTVIDQDTTSMTLQWTAPGDDGDQGTAVSYKLRYDTTPIESTTDFAEAEAASSVPNPKPANTTQTATVSGLTPDSTYYYAIRAIDDGRNQSSIGTTPKGTRLIDKIPPAPISRFHIRQVNTSTVAVTLEWEATGDDGRRGTAETYDLRYANTPIKTEEDFKNATVISPSLQPVPPPQQESITVGRPDGLEEEKTYHFALVATDNAGNTTPIATPEDTAVLTKTVRITEGGLISEQSSAETQFVVTKTQSLRVELYDLLGRQVGVLFEDRVREGFENTLRYDTISLSTGPYFLRFVGETFTETRKIMVVH